MNIERKDNGDIFATDGVGTVYSKVNGRFYRTTTDGKKTRIGEAVFEETLKDIEQSMEEELAKLVAGTEESNNTEAGEEIAAEILKAEEPKAKKERKPRKSKDVAYEAEGVTLTAKQVDFIKHLPDTCFWENGLDSCIWVDCLCDDIQGQFKGKPMTVGAMISTLCEKGLGSRGSERRDGRKCTSFQLTTRGKAVAKGLGLH